MKKFLLGACGLAASLPVFAEGTSSYTAATLGDIESAFSTFQSSAMTIAISVAAGFCAFYLLRLGVRIVKSVASAGK